MTEKVIAKEMETPKGNEKPSKQYVSTFGIVVCTLYLVLIGLLAIYSLNAFWPPDMAGPDTNPNVEFLSWSIEIHSEVRLIIIVATAGALGSLVHGFRSFFWYVGNRELVRSWVLMYFLLPFVGSSLGLIFYFVLRGGLFSGQTPVEAANPFGFAGLSGLVGMFSNQAALKLQEIAETMFSSKKSTEGKDHVSSEKDKAKDSEKTKPESSEEK